MLLPYPLESIKASYILKYLWLYKKVIHNEHAEIDFQLRLMVTKTFKINLCSINWYWPDYFISP